MLASDRVPDFSSIEVMRERFITPNGNAARLLA